MALSGLFGTAVGQDAAGNGGGGVVEKVLVRDYVGDDTNDREIDLGDDYDYVQIVTLQATGEGDNHLETARAIDDQFDVTYYASTGTQSKSRTNGSAVTYFQGKMTGGDSTKIKLGSNGTLVWGTNDGSINYRIFAMKFSSVES